VKLFDLTGKSVPITVVADESGKTRVDISHLQRGIYILHVVLSDGKMLTRKLLKN
jgi:hypothetical protein